MWKLHSTHLSKERIHRGRDCPKLCLGFLIKIALLLSLSIYDKNSIRQSTFSPNRWRRQMVNLPCTITGEIWQVEFMSVTRATSSMPSRTAYSVQGNACQANAWHLPSWEQTQQSAFNRLFLLKPVAAGALQDISGLPFALIWISGRVEASPPWYLAPQSQTASTPPDTRVESSVSKNAVSTGKGEVVLSAAGMVK